MTNNVEKDTNQFREQLGGFFHELFKNAGISLPPYTHERFRSTGERMTMLIEQVSKHKAVQIVTKLQKAVFEAFNKAETEINNVHQLTLAHQTLIGDLIAGQKHLSELVTKLELRLTEVESRINRRWGSKDSGV